MSKKNRIKRQKEAELKSSKKLNSSFSMNSWLGTKESYFALFCILAITFIAFYPSLDNDFVNWDDDINVYENPLITSLSSENIEAMFSGIVGANYNPLPILTFAIEYSFVGLDPTLYHINNLLLHLGCTALVFWLMLLLGLRPAGAIAAALLFGIHPMRVESVAWITERKDVLFAIFYLGALVTYMYYIHNKRNRVQKYALIIILFALSLLSKIQAVSLPLSMLAIDYWQKRPIKFNLIIEKIPFFLMSLITGLVGIYFLGKQDTLILTQQYAFHEKLLIGAYSLFVYLVKFIFPYEMAAFYPYPAKIGGMLPSIYYITPFILLGLAFLIYRSVRKTRAVVFGIVFFLVNIMFLLQILGAGQAFLADRFTYIAYLGLFFIVGWGLNKLLTKRPALKNVLYGGMATYLIIFLIMTFRQNDIWKNGDVMWSHIINLYPDQAADPYNNRGYYYRSIGQPMKALADYNKAISLNKDFHLSYYNRGKVYFDMQKFPEALYDYNKTIELKPDFAEAYSNRGAVYAQTNNMNQAIIDLNKAIELKPDHPEALKNRAVLHDVMNNLQAAHADYNSYLLLRPNDHEIYNNRGVLKQKLGDQNAAIQDFNIAIQLGNKDFYYMNRSLAYKAIGNNALALQDALTAQQMGNKNVTQEYLNQLR